jgi:hypothetical protein
MIKHGIKYCHLSGLKVNPGEAKLLLSKKLTKIKQVGIYNLMIYEKQQMTSQSCFR